MQRAETFTHSLVVKMIHCSGTCTVRFITYYVKYELYISSVLIMLRLWSNNQFGLTNCQTKSAKNWHSVVRALKLTWKGIQLLLINKKHIIGKIPAETKLKQIFVIMHISIWIIWIPNIISKKKLLRNGLQYDENCKKRLNLKHTCKNHRQQMN